MASAQSSPYTANQLKNRCRPIAKTTISTSASPIERHRMERIGGDRICESALTAASNMAAMSSAKTLARGRHALRVRQETAKLERIHGAALERRLSCSPDCIFQMARGGLIWARL